MTALRSLVARAAESVAWFEGRPERERIQLAVAAGAAILTLWILLLHQPVAARTSDASAGMEAARADIERLGLEIEALGAARARDPRTEQRETLARLEQETRELERRATAAGSSVLPPDQVVALLRELLAAQPDLRLVRVENLAAEPLQAEADASAASATLFRHPIEIEIEGAYLPTLRWLDVVAALPWRLHWDELLYEVTEHPRARVVLRLHTLGRAKEWIRA